MCRISPSPGAVQQRANVGARQRMAAEIGSERISLERLALVDAQRHDAALASGFRSLPTIAMILSLSAAALSAAALSAVSLPAVSLSARSNSFGPPSSAALDQSFLDQWGTLVTCAGALHFQSGGNVYELQTTGPFQDGDNVYVMGTGGTAGMQPCPQANEFFPYVTVSNFEPIVETCGCPATQSCSGVASDVGCPNSAGAGAHLSYSGMPSVTTTFYGLDLVVSGLPANQASMVFMGRAGAPATPLGDGQLCLGTGTGLGLYRYPVRAASSFGGFTEPDVVGTSQSFPSAGRISVGSTWHFQAWYRDAAGPCGNGSNTTNGLRVTFLL